MKVHNVEQGSPEWFNVRSGKVTGSNAQAIGNVGKGLDTVVIETMAEFYSSAEKEQYTNDHLERGKELEDMAATIYGMETDQELAVVGFVEYNEFVGCSPDRLVGEDGMLEIKCPNDKNFLLLLLNGEKEVDSKYVWQVQMQMLVCNRKWVDLCFYNPNFEKSMLTFRILPDEDKFNKLREGFKYAEEKIKEIKSKL